MIKIDFIRGERRQSARSQMKQKNKTRQQIPYVFLILIAILILFYIYTTQNRARIQEQNKNYAADSARQTVERIESEFDNALQRLHNSAYLVAEGTNDLKIDTYTLEKMEENTSFDTISFTNAEGVNLASDGETNNSSDRTYFIRGMQGESGLETVEKSRLTGRPMMVFYAPVYMDEKPAGVFLGMYFAEDYLRDMLTVSYFGEEADVFLCTQEGRVIASSNGRIYEDDLLDTLTEEGVIDAETARAARSVFTEGGEAALLCGEGCQTDNICVVDLPDHRYVLVQAFPKDITQQMVKKANMAGMMLEFGLLGLFVIYMAFLLVNGGRQRKKLETENTFINDILRGVNILFSSRYLVVNLEEDRYSYLAGVGPINPSIPVEGIYSELIKLHAAYHRGGRKKGVL